MTKFLFKSQISYLTLFCWCWKSKNIMRYYIRILEQFRPNNLQCPSTANNRVVRMASFDICIFFATNRMEEEKNWNVPKLRPEKLYIGTQGGQQTYPLSLGTKWNQYKTVSICNMSICLWKQNEYIKSQLQKKNKPYISEVYKCTYIEICEYIQKKKNLCIQKSICMHLWDSIYLGFYICKYNRV